MYEEFEKIDKPLSDIDAVIEKANRLTGWARELMEDAARLMAESRELVRTAQALNRKRPSVDISSNGWKSKPLTKTSGA